ncbi:MAG: hypothetical protein NC132_01595 [Corallococcus sp.]|nr:hypothetical protein [Corallococcus sp.]MCM1359351.1 hypothetical protein [Corallococcus sp.]MCM1394794.1 hypothetical protein [Corallococcus sp.]
MGKKNSNNGGGSRWSLNKISFWALTVVALMYLVSGILRLVDANNLAAAAGWVGAVASAIAICIVAILAYRYIRNKPVVWLVLYILVLLIVLVFIVLPGALGR